jgi:hypothetical protein
MRYDKYQVQVLEIWPPVPNLPRKAGRMIFTFKDKD